MRTTKRPGPSWLGCALIALFVACVASPGIAEEAKLFEERIDVSLVEIDVQVVDKRGRPVTDLTIDDFEIFENKNRMTISQFDAIIDEPSDHSARKPPSPEEHQEAVPIDRAPREDRRLRLVIFVDNFNLRALDRKRVLKSVRTYLRSNLRTDDLAMVVSFDRSLNVLQPFTNQAVRINEVLMQLEGIRAEGSRNDRDRRRLLDRIDKSDNGEASLSAIYPYADSVLHDVDLTLDALRETVSFLEGLPGRKVVLYISSGIPLIAAGDLFSAIEQKYYGISAMSGLMSFDSSRRFEELTKMANASDITFYPIDAGGLRANRSGSAEEEGLDEERVAHALDSNYQANLQDTLYHMADATGGLAIVNRNEFLPALEEIEATVRSYYSLAYLPGHHGDGRFYELKVKVKRRGVRVRHRAGYRDKSTARRMSERALSALRHQTTQNDLDIELRMGAVTPQPDGQFIVPTEVRIPLQRLILVPTEAHHVARIRLYFAAMDEGGEISEVKEIPLRMKIPSTSLEAAKGEYWVYKHQLLMGSGVHRVVLGVYDEFGTVSSFITQGLKVGG